MPTVTLNWSKPVTSIQAENLCLAAEIRQHHWQTKLVVDELYAAFDYDALQMMTAVVVAVFAVVVFVVVVGYLYRVVNWLACDDDDSTDVLHRTGK